MSFSIQTNVASLIAQNNIRINNSFQSNTIEQLSSGYRINSSADDAAGLAVANKYRGNNAELTQGVINANNGVSALQIVDGGLNNISTILDRLRTLATESASATFTGDRGTLNTEYQGLLSEVNRQAANVNLNTGGLYNTNLVTYVGGGSTQANAQVSVDLSGSNNAVDSTALGIQTT
ncbi:MAG TPA: flagellin, partial [Bryobacteraceae bacterium]|nr:flagellin [Bryobacteraceae bacterium]